MKFLDPIIDNLIFYKYAFDRLKWRRLLCYIGIHNYLFLEQNHYGHDCLTTYKCMFCGKERDEAILN